MRQQPGNSASQQPAASSPQYQRPSEATNSGYTVHAQPSVQPLGAEGNNSCPDTNADTAGVYGQNSARAASDRQYYYNAHQQQQQNVAPGVRSPPPGQQYQPYGTPQSAQPISYSSSSPYGDYDDRAPVVVAVAADVPPSPPGLICVANRNHDYYPILSFSSVNIACMVINWIICVSCFLSLSGGFSWVPLVIGVLAFALAVFLMYATKQVRMVFDRTTHAVRVTQRRLLQFCLTPRAEIRAPFQSLYDVGFVGVVGTPGEMYIDLGSTRFVFATRTFSSDTQIFQAVHPWRAYIAQLRGVALHQLGRPIVVAIRPGRR
jgi:hypothetical protein